VVNNPDDEEEKEYWVAILDIDDFKVINDTYGHNCGDTTLKVLAEIISHVDQEVEKCRWGGEEFLFIMVGMNGDEACIDVIDLCHEIEKMTIPAGERELHVTMTFGVEERHV
jgi:diguanylate cyclase (GGDEF)-like protein